MCKVASYDWAHVEDVLRYLPTQMVFGRSRQVTVKAYRATFLFVKHKAHVCFHHAVQEILGSHRTESGKLPASDIRYFVSPMEPHSLLAL